MEKHIFMNGNYFFFILVSIIFEQYFYIEWIIELIKFQTFRSFMLLLNLLLGYIILYKIKFNFTFSINFN